MVQQKDPIWDGGHWSRNNWRNEMFQTGVCNDFPEWRLAGGAGGVDRYLSGQAALGAGGDSAAGELRMRSELKMGGGVARLGWID